MNYLDFDLVIEPSKEGYTARVFNSPGGQASVDFAAPFSDLEIENFLLRVGRTRHAVRRIESPEMASAKAFGGRLFNVVFAGDLRGCLRSSLDEASRQGAGLRVRLHLGKAPALADLPWEFLYNAGMNRFLGLSVETPLIRYLDLPERIRPVSVKPPLHVLMMISSPSDYPQLDVDRESAKMTEALADLEQRGLVTVERQENATLAELQRRLRQSEYHIFHFIGHGGFDDQAQDGLLILEDAEQRGRRVSAQFLGTLLHDHRPLRLAILNACEGARAARGDPFAGTAQSLVQQGIPAVIAMQFEVTDDAAICFTREFYAAIAGGYPVDAALAEARKAIFAEVSEIEWGTPVLYMRSPDGRIFDVEQVSEADRKQLQTTSLLAGARSAHTAGDDAVAIEKLNELLRAEPKHAGAAELLREISGQREIANYYAAGRAAYDEGKWDEALRLLGRLDRSYRDVDTLIGLAQKAKERAAGEEQRKRKSEERRRAATAAMAAERWGEAIEQWQALAPLEPDDPQVRAQLTEARRQEDLAERYTRGRSCYERRKWREAQSELQQIQHMAGAYKDVVHLLGAVERELGRASSDTSETRGGARVVPGAPPAPHPPQPHAAPPPAAPAVQPLLAARPPARAKWFFLGGALGVVVLAGIVLFIGIIALALKGSMSDSQPPATASLVDDGPAVPAPAPPVAAPPVAATPPPPRYQASDRDLVNDGPAPATVTDALRAALRDAITRADNAEILAFRTLTPTPLYGSYAGEILKSHLSALEQLRAANLFMVNTLSNQRFDRFSISPDGLTAEVTFTERWSSNFFSLAAPSVCLSHVHDHDIPQTAHMRLVGQNWMIYSSVQDPFEPEHVACH